MTDQKAATNTLIEELKQDYLYGRAFPDLDTQAGVMHALITRIGLAESSMSADKADMVAHIAEQQATIEMQRVELVQVYDGAEAHETDIERLEGVIRQMEGEQVHLVNASQDVIAQLKMEQVKVDLLKKLRDEQLKVIQDSDLSYVSMRTMMRKYRDRSDRLTNQLKAAREWKEIAEGFVAHFKSCADCWECLIESDPAIAKRYDRAVLAKMSDKAATKEQIAQWKIDYAVTPQSCPDDEWPERANVLALIVRIEQEQRIVEIWKEAAEGGENCIVELQARIRKLEFALEANKISLDSVYTKFQDEQKQSTELKKKIDRLRERHRA